MYRINRRKRYFILPIILAALAGFSLVTMLLWNSLMPVIFHLPQISFLQAIGMLVLTRLLFGFSGPWNRHRGHFLREKWTHMSQEEREAFMQRWHGIKSCKEESK